ncbi:MAG: SRPBCC family protein [Actinomycetota bacterium]
MELTNEFVIDRNIEETWKILNDLEFIAPCMPGAQLTEIEGDEYRGLVKIKVGPITANYKGKASFIEQDVENKVARLKAEGRDPRQGNANAMVTATMTSVGDDQTNVEIHTDLGLSGKIASFGRGAIEDVSKKILGQFTDNLRDKLEEGTDGPAAAAPAATAPAAAPVTAADAPAPAASAPSADNAAAPSPGIRKIDSPEAEAVDLLDVVAGDSMAKKALPAAGVAALVLAIIYWILR